MSNKLIKLIMVIEKLPQTSMFPNDMDNIMSHLTRHLKGCNGELNHCTQSTLSLLYQT